MIAEIYNKVSSSASNLSEKLEDELTGNFFGNLRYLPFNRGLKQILIRKMYTESKNIKDIVSNINVNEWDIEFWKKSELGYGEIDAYIEFNDFTIGIEVKLYSGLSSDNQLIRESKMLNEWRKNGEKILLFVADEVACKQYYEKNKNGIDKDVVLCYLTWQDALEGLELVITNNSYEKLIIQDLQSLLRKKGFERFVGFNINSNLLVEGGKSYVFR